MHTIKEQKIIRLFMAALCLGIVMVYILLFQIKGNMLQGKTTTATLGSGILIDIMSGNDEQGQREPLQLTTGEETSIALPTTGVTILSEPGNTATSYPANIHILSGTNIFYGTIEAIEKLGIKYTYALIDAKNIYYINMGNPTYDFAGIARKLGGNLYELKTEAELMENKLFGDRVVFINLPEYKEKRVLMLLYIDEEVRLIQMDYAMYHKSKSYLKSLFIE